MEDPMKVSGTPNITAYLDRLRKTEASDDQGRKHKGHDPEKEKKDESSQEEPKKFDPSEVSEAALKFSEDAHSGPDGLKARVEGVGPGLRVTLRDGQGAVVRQLTGEEFMRLKEASQGQARGRLLDKKL